MSKTFVEPTMTEALILWAIITLIHSIIAYKVYRTVGDKHLEKNTKEILENHIDPDEEIIDIEQGAIPIELYIWYGPLLNFGFAGLMLLFWKGIPEVTSYIFILPIVSCIFFFLYRHSLKSFIKLRKRVIVLTNKSFIISLPQNKIRKTLFESIKDCWSLNRHFNFYVYYKKPFKRKKDVYTATKITLKIREHFKNYTNSKK